MSTSEGASGASSSAEETLATVEAVSQRIRSRRRWYVVGALVMAAALATFNIALASWPERVAEVIIPGLLFVAGIFVLLSWAGRTIPAAATAVTNRIIFIGAGLMLVTLLLNRLVLPEGFSVWVVLTGLLPALPFIYLAWRVGRA